MPALVVIELQLCSPIQLTLLTLLTELSQPVLLGRNNGSGISRVRSTREKYIIVYKTVAKTWSGKKINLYNYEKILKWITVTEDPMISLAFNISRTSC